MAHHTHTHTWPDPSDPMSNSVQNPNPLCSGHSSRDALKAQGAVAWSRNPLRTNTLARSTNSTYMEIDVNVQETVGT